MDGGVVNEGFNSTLAGLKGSPRAAEEIDIARVIILAETLGLRAHVCHVSTRSGVQLLREAKRRGVRVTAETCPHYFTLTDDAVTGFDANTKVNPPLREQGDVDAIKAGLADGTLDCIVTDHAPHHADEKNVEYNLAAFGISGIETSFSLSYTALVRGGVLTLEQLAEKMSAAPARILGLEGGALKEGAVADLMLAIRISIVCHRPRRIPLQGQEHAFQRAGGVRQGEGDNCGRRSQIRQIKSDYSK